MGHRRARLRGGPPAEGTDDEHHRVRTGRRCAAAGTTSSTTGGPETGGCSYEPPGDIHTLEVPEDVDAMVTLFHVSGAYVYVDPDGAPVGVEDVFTKIANARKHYEAVGLGADFVDQSIR